MYYETFDDYDFIMEHVFGLVTIDLNGIVTYINKQVCDFCGIDYEWAKSGKHINEVFPFSKMTDTLRTKSPSDIEFYHYTHITSNQVNACTARGRSRQNRKCGEHPCKSQNCRRN